MTNKQINNKLEKLQRYLEELIEELTAVVEALEEKQNNIEYTADERGRDMTDSEQERYDDLERRIEVLQGNIDTFEYVEIEMLEE